MKHNILVTVFTIIALLLAACDVASNTSQSDSNTDKTFNICLVLDGTDIHSLQNGVPKVTGVEIDSLASKFTSAGLGSLYVTYIDTDCDNNPVSVFEWKTVKPEEPGAKPGYMQMSEYHRNQSAYAEAYARYRRIRTCMLNEFSLEVAKTIRLAYSDDVAKARRGSDVNGAINQAVKLLGASASAGNPEGIIILVSDGVDNVGKPINTLPPSVELLIVNTNVIKHQYSDLVFREFATLNQAINYIFKKKSTTT